MTSNLDFVVSSTLGRVITAMIMDSVMKIKGIRKTPLQVNASIIRPEIAGAMIGATVSDSPYQPRITPCLFMG